MSDVGQLGDSDKPHFPTDDLKVDFGKMLKAASDPKRMADFRRQEDERREREMQERAERARTDALARFMWLDEVPGWVCPGCSALVHDREQHLDWHGALADTARDASEAAWRGRPIG